MANPSIRPASGAEARMSGYLARVATGPELSKDLSRAEAEDGMRQILSGAVDRAQAAVFLIALRMKRETHDELCGVLDALRAYTATAVAEVDDLVDMAEPYNGYVRHLPAAPFVPALLAACDVPCVLHGVHELGPKWGLTAHPVLAHAGAGVDRTPAEAARSVADVGWAYIDQTHYCPELASLARLRTLIVKRPCLSLVEKLLQPVTARGRDHLWVGYAHLGYPEILARLARDLGYHSMLAVRGVESGVLTSLAGRAAGFAYVGGGDLEPLVVAAREVVGPDPGERAPPLPGDPAGKRASGPPSPATLDRWAQAAATHGLGALTGEPGPTAEMMVLGAAAILRHLGRVENLAEGAERARAAITSGEAMARFAALQL